MANSSVEEYYRSYQGVYLLGRYLDNKNAQDTRLNYILAFIIICILLATLALTKPILAKSDTGGGSIASSPPDKIEKLSEAQLRGRIETTQGGEIYDRAAFEKNIREKYKNSYVTFPASGIAHIKKTKYINSKPIKINIVELNTNVNPYLKIKPQTASTKLNARSTVRKIAQKENAIVAINAGFFKPQTGVPLGALMIDGKVLTGPIFNRVGIGIFEEKHKTTFKMDNISFNINAKTKNHTVHIDNINQPRILQSYMLLYTDDWGKASPTAPATGYNLLIRNHKPIKVSANSIPLEQGDMVLQGNKDTISKLGREAEIYIDIKMQEGFEDAKHIIGAGPYLVKNSQIYVDVKTQKLQAISGKNPRSAVGYKKDGTLIIVTVDGREQASVGMTLTELASLMKSLGCEYAMNFDGGSSSAMYVNGKIANSAHNREGVSVSNALVVVEANPYEMHLAGI